MKDYSYIAVVEPINDYGCRFIVRSKDSPINDGSIVVLTINRRAVYAKVLHSAYLQFGGEEEAMLAEFGEIRNVEKIYCQTWENDEEVTEDGN